MRDIHEFSGRGSDHELTEFINQRVLAELAVQPEDRLVDTGCGNETLLRLAVGAGVSNPTGLVSDSPASLPRAMIVCSGEN